MRISRRGMITTRSCTAWICPTRAWRRPTDVAKRPDLIDANRRVGSISPSGSNIRESLRVVVFGAAFYVEPIVDRLEYRQHLVHELLVDFFGGPLGPEFYVFGVGGADDAGGHVGVADGELEREL